MKHSPQIALIYARTDRDRARAECPHWDYTSDSDGEHYTCCYNVDEADRAYKRALKAASK